MSSKQVVGISIVLLWMPFWALAGDQPDYQASVLTVPRVDTPEQVGQYQDATFRLESDGRWQLESLRALEQNGGIAKMDVDAVDAVTTSSFPVGVNLRVDSLVLACSFDGPPRLLQRRQDRHFQVAILAPQVKDPNTHTCIGSVYAFRLTIPLDVYGLGAGTYTYDVNGVTGSFTLVNDNKYVDDCWSPQNIDYCGPRP